MASIDAQIAPLIAKLRPAKVRSALRRRRFEFIFERTPLRGGVPTVALGRSYGGWVIPEGIVEPSWVCYCVGAGGDVSFDLELIRRYGATVRAFEPVPGYVELAEREATGEERFSIHQVAIARSDGPIRMQVTHDAQSRSVSAAGLYDSHEFIELPGRTLPSLMSELGDERIDLLKLDVEGTEYELLADVDLRAFGVKVFAIQLHHTGTVRQARELIARLRRDGYEPVAERSSVKLTFLNEELLSGANRPAEGS
jgi:FkbM family methyltransferase